MLVAIRDSESLYLIQRNIKSLFIKNQSNKSPIRYWKAQAIRLLHIKLQVEVIA